MKKKKEVELNLYLNVKQEFTLFRDVVEVPVIRRKQGSLR